PTTSTGPRAEPYRRNQPHTTHLEGFPPSVTITRPPHPFPGHTLAGLGWAPRCRQLHRGLVPPDGSRSLIPATWTDFEGGVTATGRPPHTSLATLPDLLQARPVVVVLLLRSPPAGEGPSAPDAEEGHRAI